MFENILKNRISLNYFNNELLINRYAKKKKKQNIKYSIFEFLLIISFNQ